MGGNWKKRLCDIKHQWKMSELIGQRASQPSPSFSLFSILLLLKSSPTAAAAPPSQCKFSFQVLHSSLLCVYLTFLAFLSSVGLHTLLKPFFFECCPCFLLLSILWFLSPYSVHLKAVSSLCHKFSPLFFQVSVWEIINLSSFPSQNQWCSGDAGYA